jgi:hypothetical protein
VKEVVVVAAAAIVVGRFKWVLLMALAYTNYYLQMYSCIISEYEMF